MRPLRSLTTALLMTAALAALAGCSTDEPPAAATPSATASSSPSQLATEGDGSCAYVETGGAARQADLPDPAPEATGSVQIRVVTDAGTIGVALDAAAAPCTVASFLSLAEQGYFDDTQCHRLTTEGIYVLQCGDPSATGRGGPGYTFADELDGTETYPAGTLAMANAGPDTNGSQFFLVYADSQLPPAYTVFGHLDEPGLAVVQAVAAEGVDGGAGDGPPAVPVTIESVSVD